MTPSARVDPVAADVVSHLVAVQERVRRLVDQRRAGDPQPDDPFRGLYLTDEAVDRALSEPPDALAHAVRSWQQEPEPTDVHPHPSMPGRLEALARTCH